MSRTLQELVVPELNLASLAQIGAVQSKSETKAHLRHARRIAGTRFARLTAHAEAKKHLDPLPGPGEAVHGVMDGRFSAWSIVQSVVDLLPVPVDSLVIGTLGFNRTNCTELCELLDSSKIRQVLLVVSDYFRSSDRTIFADCRHELETRGQRVGITRSHAKLLLFEAGDQRLVVETSANLRSSMNYEQFSIFHDADLLAFHRGWIAQLLEESANGQ